MSKKQLTEKDIKNIKSVKEKVINSGKLVTKPAKNKTK